MGQVKIAIRIFIFGSQDVKEFARHSVAIGIMCRTKQRRTKEI